MTDIILTDEGKSAVAECELIAKDVEGYHIVDVTAYTSAAEILKKIKSKAKEITDIRLSITQPLDASKKNAMEFFKKPLDFLKNAEIKIKDAMIGWDRKQEEIRRKEEERLAELQRKEVARLAKRAAKAAEKGQEEKAEQLQQQSQQAEAFKPIVPEQTTKVAGIQKRKVWKVRIKDINIIPREYLIPNDKMLGDLARATKGTLNIPGVEFYSEDIISSGRG